MPIEILPFKPADLPEIVRIQHASTMFRRYSLIELERDLTALAPELRSHFLLARDNGEAVGVANAHRTAGSYHPHKFQIEVYVLPDRRRQGAGRALYEATLKMLEPLDPISLRTQVSESDTWTLEFARRRGFVETKRDFVSNLDILSFDLSPFAGIEARLMESGIAMASLEELDSPEFRREWHKVFSEVRKDTPRADPISPITFEFFEAHVVDDEELYREATIFALRGGRIIGFSGCYRGVTPGWVDQWLTAVVRKERGQGLALALKLRMIRVARAAGFKTIQTDNDTLNAPMLAVNDRLGFVRQPAVLSMLKDMV